MKKYVVWLLAGFLTACNNTEEPHSKEYKLPKEGLWLAQIALNDSTQLPFHFELSHTTDSTFSITIQNAGERIEVTEITHQGDSITLQMPVFGNYITVMSMASEMRGSFHNPDAVDYHLPFFAQWGIKERFPTLESNCCDINEKWRVRFSPDAAEEGSDAVAYFNQQDSLLTATFMTETGDYRYLEGVLSGEELYLSAFDGAHLFYFEARVKGGQKLTGRFYSGRSFMEPWMAFRDDDFVLRNPDSLTYLKEGYDSLAFSFSSTEGQTVSLEDERFKGKPVIVQIMGSWCPNCMDETRFLNQMYATYHGQGLEIVGLTFERARSKEAALARAQKMKRDLEVKYPVLMAGYTRQDKAGEALPMLNHIMSYPTAIYLNRDHEVVRIHTGFAGPGTPVYDKYVTDTDLFIKSLVNNE